MPLSVACGLRAAQRARSQQINGEGMVVRRVRETVAVVTLARDDTVAVAPSVCNRPRPQQAPDALAA